MDIDKIKSLEGRIERVIIDRKVNYNCSFGTLDGFDILVSYVLPKYIGEECLVRFDSKQDPIKGIAIGNFLTSDVPIGFEGLSQEEYVLCAEWPLDLKRRDSRAPSVEELNRYYNPGSIISYYFLGQNSSTNKGRFMVYTNGDILFSSSQSLTKTIREEFKETNIFPRLLVAEGSEQINLAIKAIQGLSLIPIELESIEDFLSYL
jgi:hypothetical protein